VGDIQKFGAQIFAFNLNTVYILHINQAEMSSIRVSGIP
jgi:hypothetical protein